MWHTRKVLSSNGRIIKLSFLQQDMELKAGNAIQMLATDEEFRHFFLNELAQSPFEAFRWETPPLTSSNVDNVFECVLIEDRQLMRTADPQAFSQQLGSHTDDAVIVFKNLGGDAVLIVPRPVSGNGGYGHLAEFVRDAPALQKQQLFHRIGETMLGKIGERPIWLNTAGAGVPWLHVRIDSTPKYYRYSSYCTVG